MGYIKKLKNNELVGGTDKTTIYPVTSAEAVFEEVSDGEFKSQKYLNNHITNERIVDNTIENRKLKDDTIDMGKLNTQLKTTIQNAYDASWKVKEEPFSLETKYDANDVVYDPDTNSSYVSLTADNQGNPVRLEDEEEVNPYWRLVINGISAVQATEEIEETKNELIDYIQENLKDQVDEEITDANARIEAAERYAQGVVATAETMAQQITDWTGPDIADTPSYVDIHPLSNRASTAQIGYYTCTGGSGATIIVDDTDAAAFTPVKGGQVKILMTQKSAVTSGNVQLQFGSVTATKKVLVYNEEPVSSNNTWELGEIISIYYDGTKYHASSAQGGSNKKINAYLYNDVIPLTVGQVYSVGESVKTTDKQLRVITKDITPLSTSEEYVEGDIKKGNTATYLVTSPVSYYSITKDSKYSDGSFAIGRPAGITVGVEVENPVAGTITVVLAGVTMEIEVTSESDANDIAGKLVSNFGNQETWALINNGDGTLQLKSKYGVINPPSVAPEVTPSDSGVSIAFVSGSSYTGATTLSKYNGESWIAANNTDLVTDGILEPKDEAWLIENATGQNSITKEHIYYTTKNLFGWSNASAMATTTAFTVSLANNKFKVTGRNTDQQNNNRFAWLNLFSSSVPLEDGKSYKIIIDYKYKKTTTTNINIGLSNTTSSIRYNLFTLTSAATATKHFEKEFIYNSYYGTYLIFNYIRNYNGDYIEITNISIVEVKTLRSKVFENEADIADHEARIKFIESTKAVELFDFDSARITAGSATTAVKDTTTNTIKFTVTNGNNNSTRYTYIILPNGLIEGITYRISFDYIATHTNGNIFIRVGNSESPELGRLARTTVTKSIGFNYTHASSNTRILFEFYHVLTNEYAYINNLSIRLIGNTQEVADDFDRHIRANKKLITEFGNSLQKNGLIETEKGNFTWYSYSGNKILQPNRVGIETIIKHTSQDDSDYTGFPQGFSIWGDYAFGFLAASPSMHIFNIKERKKVGRCTVSGWSGTVNARHSNSLDFTNIYYVEGDEFPLLYVSGSENRDGTNLNGVDYLMRITRNGDSFTCRRIQTINVVNRNTGSNFYHNTAIDRRTGKLWFRRVTDVGDFADSYSHYDMIIANLPTFERDANGAIVEGTSTIEVDITSPTYSFEPCIANISNIYKWPQGGCINNGIAYISYGTSETPRIIHVINIDTGETINALNVQSTLHYDKELEDFAFWGTHMITASGRDNYIYELHWE